MGYQRWLFFKAGFHKMIKHAPRTRKIGESLLRVPVKTPTHEEDLELIVMAQGGSMSARNELIMRHMPAVIKFAGLRYKIYGSPSHVEVEDLIHVGVFGMIHAIRKYDVRKSRGRFIVYARYWLRNYMNKAVNTYRLYYLPETTRFAYAHGTLHNPVTQRAVENFQHMGYIENDTLALDSRLSPAEEAIFNEELLLLQG
jgi:RNA polymerase sigma factor (sigma-70 family)